MTDYPPPPGPPGGGPPGGPPPGGGPPGGPPPGGYSQLSPSDERTWGLLAHVGALLAAFVALAFLGPLLVLLIQGNKSAFVRRHAIESLNFQITLLIALAAGIVLSVVTLGLGLIIVLPVGLVVGILALVWIIMAGIKANNGEDYRYPINIRLVK
jgi:uncharacterized Tic20 family protein